MYKETIHYNGESNALQWDETKCNWIHWTNVA